MKQQQVCSLTSLSRCFRYLYQSLFKEDPWCKNNYQIHWVWNGQMSFTGICRVQLYFWNSKASWFPVPIPLSVYFVLLWKKSKKYVVNQCLWVFKTSYFMLNSSNCSVNLSIIHEAAVSMTFKIVFQGQNPKSWIWQCSEIITHIAFMFAHQNRKWRDQSYVKHQWEKSRINLTLDQNCEKRSRKRVALRKKREELAQLSFT